MKAKQTCYKPRNLEGKNYGCQGPFADDSNINMHLEASESLKKGLEKILTDDQ